MYDSTDRSAVWWTAELAARMIPHVQELEDQGYTIVENALTEDQLERVRAAINRLGGGAIRAAADTGFTGRRLGNLFARDEVFRELTMSAQMRYLIEQQLGAEYLLTSNSSIDLQPGEVHGPLHTDELLYNSVVPWPHPPLVCNTVWAIDDFTEANGATLILPGSHREQFKAGAITDMGQLSPNLPDGVIQLVMPKGSMLVLSGSVWHTGGSNVSDASRLALVWNFCAGWIRPEHNNTLVLPIEEVRQLPVELQVMLGFGMYREFIGNINHQHPLDALAN